MTGWRVRMAVAAGLLILSGAVLAMPLPEASARDNGASSSAVTVRGSGPFSDLEVTVSQTRQLRNQTVDITWRGGTPTLPTLGNFAFNYVQIMQCWGDGPEPEREKCQFGGLTGDPRGGNWASTRQVTYGPTLVDEEETYRAPPGSTQIAYVPFTSVTGVTTTEVRNDFYDGYSTNEVPFGRTYVDGTGHESFEVQTAKEAAGLGCGAPTASGPRPCWLVIVPRGRLEVNGLEGAEDLDSSPLSASNWQHRIAVPLSFEPVGLSCPIGAAERPINGQEGVADAISRWQPKLCVSAGSIFGFWQMSDELARNHVLQDDPQLSVVSRPVPPEAVPEGLEIVHAPVAAGAIGIGFNIERQVLPNAPPDVKARAGTRVETLKLTPRLVLKLLTQSYRGASLDPAALPADNPRSLGADPEFLQLNPEFESLDIRTLTRIVVPAGLSDAYGALWEWLAADPDVKAFVAGEADVWGMKINPAYQGMELHRSNFPIQDLACRPADGEIAELCPLDFLAYSADLHEGGRAAARGQNLARDTWSFNATGGWKLSPPQLSGTRAVLVLVDTATAHRYGLPLASLKTSAGVFVPPDLESMTAALSELQDTAVAGVDGIDVTPDAPDAYPLTLLSYAVTAPEQLSAAEATAYAAFLRYAATKGQQPGEGVGQLPAGYSPLPKSLRAETLAVAAIVARRGADVPTATPTSTPTPTPSPTDTTGRPGPITVPSVPGPLPPVTAPSAAPVPSAATSAPPAVVAASYQTPAVAIGSTRLVVSGALLLAALIVAGRPLLGWQYRRSVARR